MQLLLLSELLLGLSKLLLGLSDLLPVRCHQLLDSVEFPKLLLHFSFATDEAEWDFRPKLQWLVVMVTILTPVVMVMR
jgi:hypothetical protein